MKAKAISILAVCIWTCTATAEDSVEAMTCYLSEEGTQLDCFDENGEAALQLEQIDADESSLSDLTTLVAARRSFRDRRRGIDRSKEDKKERYRQRSDPRRRGAVWRSGSGRAVRPFHGRILDR